MSLETLHIITLSICLFTLVLATAALMPQLKSALVLVRDTLLWATLIIAVSFAGFLVWGRVFEASSVDLNQARSTGASRSFLSVKSEDEVDPLPLPTKDDEMEQKSRSDGQTARPHQVPPR